MGGPAPALPSKLTPNRAPLQPTPFANRALPPLGTHPPLCRPNATWSPGGAPGGGTPQDLALKRALNWLGSVAVPVGVLAVKSPTSSLYATQLAFLKDQSGAVYYYNSPVNNGAPLAASVHLRAHGQPWGAACCGRMPGRHGLLLPGRRYGVRCLCQSAAPRRPPASCPSGCSAPCVMPRPRPVLCARPAGWLKIDVGALSDAQQGTYFPVAAAAPEVPFATDVTGGAAA